MRLHGIIRGVYLALFLCVVTGGDAKQQRCGSSNTEYEWRGREAAA